MMMNSLSMFLLWPYNALSSVPYYTLLIEKQCLQKRNIEWNSLKPKSIVPIWSLSSQLYSHCRIQEFPNWSISYEKIVKSTPRYCLRDECGAEDTPKQCLTKKKFTRLLSQKNVLYGKGYIQASYWSFNEMCSRVRKRMPWCAFSKKS